MRKITSGSCSSPYKQGKTQRMLRSLFTALLAAVLAVTILVPCISAFAEESTPTSGTPAAHKYNIVFIIDNSGSTISTDPALFRKEAIDYFLAIMTDSGNVVGGIVFQESPDTSLGMVVINSAADKQTVSNYFILPQKAGATDIGTAVLAGTKMLDEYGDPNLPSAIILMTDGRTEDIRNITQSYDNRNLAINTAITNEYPIYCVGLNADGSVNREELETYTNQTGGVYREVSTAVDLPAVFEAFYELIYGSERNTIFEGSGSFDVNFKVPAAGVEDVNIIVYSSQKLRSLELYKPDGAVLTQEEISGITTVSNTFTVVKITNPAKGKWQVSGQGAENDQVKIDMMQNFNLDVSASIKDATSEYPVGGDIALVAQITQGGQPVSDQEAYSDYSASIQVSDDSSFSSPTDIPMTPGDLQYEGIVTPEKEGVLYARVVLSGDYFFDVSNPVEIEVKGTIPPPFGEAAHTQTSDTGGIPWIPIIIGLVVAVAAVAVFLLLRKSRGARPDLFGNLKIVVKRNYEARPASWRRLAPYGKEVNLLDLLDRDPDFSEVSGIRILGDENAVRILSSGQSDIHFFEGYDDSDVRLRDSEGFEIRLQDGITSIECTWSRS